MPFRRTALPLILTAAALGGAGCGDSIPAPCSRCPDVGGRYVLTRTVRSAIDCPAAPIGGEVLMHVGQNGSRVELEYEGAVLKGQLLEDGSLAAETQTTREEADGSWQHAYRFSGSFREDRDGMRLDASLIDRRRPLDPASNRGRDCVISVDLAGWR